MSKEEDKIIAKAKDSLMKQASPAMGELLDNDNTKMPEAVFKGRYLDSFMNGATGVAIKEFASVAGSFYKGVDIVDDDNNVLFTTPPMMETPDFSDISELTKADISGVVNETETRIAVNHPEPTKALDTTIASFEDSLIAKAKETNIKNEEKWADIFKRYIPTEPDVDDEDIEYVYD